MSARHCLSEDESRLVCPVCEWRTVFELDATAAMHTHLAEHTPAEWLRALARARAH